MNIQFLLFQYWFGYLYCCSSVWISINNCCWAPTSTMSLNGTPVLAGRKVWSQCSPVIKVVMTVMHTHVFKVKVFINWDFDQRLWIQYYILKWIETGQCWTLQCVYAQYKWERESLHRLICKDVTCFISIIYITVIILIYTTCSKMQFK